MSDSPDTESQSIACGGGSPTPISPTTQRTHPEESLGNRRKYQRPSRKTIVLLSVEALIGVGLIAGIGLSFNALRTLAPIRDFLLEDRWISHPFNPVSTVEMWAVYTFLAGAFILACIAEFVQHRSKLRLALLAHTLILCSALLTITIDFLKVMTGRLRPDFLERCMPDSFLQCTNPDEGVVWEGRVSFPSGHSAWTAFPAAIMSIYTSRALGVTKVVHSQPLPQLWWVRALGTVVLPWTFAVYTAVSRTFDYKHHPSDVVVGAAIGASIGFGGGLWVHEAQMARMAAVENTIDTDCIVVHDETKVGTDMSTNMVILASA